MIAYTLVLARQDKLIEDMRNKRGVPLADFADLFAGILGSLPLIANRSVALRKCLRVIRSTFLTADEDLIISRHAYRNIRRAFYILLFMPLEKLPSKLYSNDPYDPIPFFAAWRLLEGI